MQQTPTPIDMKNMVKQVIIDATMDVQKVLNCGITSTTTPKVASEKRPEFISRDMNPVTLKRKLIDGFRQIISSAESIIGVKKVTPRPTAFFLKQQTPTAHLSILRNPTRAYEQCTPAFSPGLGHASDTYKRFIERKWLQDRMIVENNEFILAIENRAHRTAQKQRYNKARKTLSQFQKNYDAWVYDRQPVKNLCEEVHEDDMFWRKFNQDKEVVPIEAGEEEEVWFANGNDILLGQVIEKKMQLQGRSIEEWDGLKKAVEDEQEQRHQKMVKHREQWRASKYIPEDYDSDTDEEDSEDDDNDNYGHLYDDVDPCPVKISEVVAKDEAITTIATSPSDIPQRKVAETEERPALSEQRVENFKPQPDFIVDTETRDTTNTSTHQDSSDMASTTKTTKEIVTETDAILSLANTLVADLKDRYEFYYTSSNVHMNTVLEAMRPGHLGNKCTWIVRPLAMTKKNLTPPPASQPPVIRLTNPSGVTCELIEAFENLDTPYFKDFVAWRDEEQDCLIQAVQEWREKEETFDDYDRRLVCEEFWDECLEKDLKRALDQRRNRERIGVIYEDDSDDDDDWDEYTYSRMSRSSSMNTSVPDLEEDNNTTTIEPVTIADEEEEEEDAETKLDNASAVARTNLATYTKILASAVASAKTEALAIHTAKLDAPKLAQQAEEDKRVKASYTHNLSYSITRLRLRMAQDGLIPLPSNGLIYTSSKPVGPASITFTGPITQFLLTNQTILNRAFTTLVNDKRIQALYSEDFYKEVNKSMGIVKVGTNLERDVRKGKGYNREMQEAKGREEGRMRVWRECVHEGVEGAVKWVREQGKEDEEKNMVKEEENGKGVVFVVAAGDVIGVEIGVGGKVKEKKKDGRGKRRNAKNKWKAEGKGKKKNRKGGGKGKK